jgi:DNA-binding SARP family transcriptional activator/Tfp pilus assembly protein PilF
MAGPTFRLLTLGGLTLEREGQPIGGIGNRKVPLALLALLAGNGAQGISRDKLVAYFWPDSDEPRARNSLKQVLFGLRRELGDSLLMSAGPTLRLDPSAIGCDLADFDAALVARGLAAAAELYRGPFLDGFYLPGRPELERWIEVERQRLHRLHVESLVRLARGAETDHDVAGAVRWWRQASAADQFSADAALGVMRALAATGDRAGALEHGRSYEAAVAAELGLPAEAAVREFARSLRLPDPAPPIETEAPPAASVFHPQALAAAMATSAPLGVPATRVRPVAVRWSGYLLPLILVLALAGAVFLLRSSTPDPVAPGAPATLTVLPFQAAGDASGDLGRGLDALLSSGLDGVADIRAVPAVLTGGNSDAPGGLTGSAASDAARRSGARLYVVGRLVADRDSLRATASLRDRANADREVSRAQATVSRDGLFTLADELVRRLVADRVGGPGERLARSAAISTRSLPALKAYLDGEQRLRDDEYVAAIDAFNRAVRADTAFGLAYYRLSVAADRAGREEASLWSARLASRFSTGLSEHDQRLVLAYLTVRNGRLDEGERIYRGILADYPQDVEAWLQLGDLLLHGNPLRGRSALDAREAFERVLALAPDQGDALVPLARIATLEGKRTEADSLLRRAEATVPAAALDLRAIRTFALNDRPGHERAARDLLADRSILPRRLAFDVAVKLGDLAGSARFAGLLVRASATCDVRALGRRMLAQVAIAHGRLGVAAGELARAAPCDPGAALEHRALLVVQPFAIPDAADLEELARDLGVVADSVLGHPAREYYAGLVAIGLGDTLTAAADARALLAAGESTSTGDLSRTFGRSLRARMLWHAGRPAEALAELEAAGWERTARLSVAEASDRYLRAELLHHLGRDEEAIGWYRSIAQRASYELVYVAPAERRLAMIYDARGDQAAAREHYRRFIDLWREADPQLQPAVAEAERRLGELDGGRRRDERGA